ncbi:anhydro-N-acetylmuramic acid kinase [Oceanimonas sp. CHS3-5]|uniref:anhydro-N-acetylmuramic acid kinase n=1 Tax=Oceanimonas sp. CHS3-5 TaxID=3068186 RepID=UPI00273D7F79|nr:anhydro-N-acetylmuramic acid kinase [Oceanimonas sp. CHS3-5]MDP5292864.1 anhydro-N-acetylmuramic acid kinase [Oceanimonas sp. CHS3-5]
MVMEHYIGIMSGTSLDGIDAVLVATDGRRIELKGSASAPIASALRERLLALAGGDAITAKEWGELDVALGQAYAEVTLQLLASTGMSAEQVRAIGCHGQTVWHQPDAELPFSLQLGDGNRLAALSGITTVTDFRRKDMALGGQGAPLVPAFHQCVLSHPERLRILVNIGGIANISVLEPGRPVQGYDVGPGNMLMDAWCRRHTGATFDKDAALGRQGRVLPELLSRLLSEPWLGLPAPKSTGRELFNAAWLDARLNGDEAMADVQATLAEFTASAIAQQAQGFAAGELLVCGGGGHNPLLMARLHALLPGWRVATTSAAGVDMDAMEAMAFAWLAHQTLHHLPGNLPEATGARRPAVLGAIHFPD